MSGGIELVAEVLLIGQETLDSDRNLLVFFFSIIHKNALSVTLEM